MTGGLIQLVGGKRYVGPGKIVVADECCCVEEEDHLYKLTPCAESETCEDGSLFCGVAQFPKHMTISIAGMVPFPGGCWTGCLTRAPEYDPQPMELFGVTDLNGSWRVNHKSECSHIWEAAHGGHGGGTTNSWCEGDPLYRAGDARNFDSTVTFRVAPWPGNDSWYAVYATQCDLALGGGCYTTWHHFFCIIERDDLCNNGVAVGQLCHHCGNICGDNGLCTSAFGYLQSGGQVTVYAGDIQDETTQCPGGAPIYSRTRALSYRVGQAVLIYEGPNQHVWYHVSEVTSGSPVVDVTIIDWAETCQDACN